MIIFKKIEYQLLRGDAVTLLLTQDWFRIVLTPYLSPLLQKTPCKRVKREYKQIKFEEIEKYERLDKRFYRNSP